MTAERARFPHSILDRAKGRIVREVRALFNDSAKGQQPVERSSEALFAPESPIWRVHGDVTSMMVGGVTALLLQMLHPAVLAGVWDHSNFRHDMLGRLRRTARFIATTTYGHRQDALAAIDKVRSVHADIAGFVPEGSAYRADDPELLAWVHMSEAWAFYSAWQRLGDAPLTTEEADRYFDEFARIGIALGAAPLPRNFASTQHAIEAMRSTLKVTHRTREVARLVLRHPPSNPLGLPVQKITMQAAVDLLPAWARDLHGLARTPAIVRPVLSTTMLGFASTLRWAFRSD